ncbi:MAG: hypothetical protein F4227_10675 [Gammaproteobacteria bacterium]|nr:hypothetical protein [Gammaproteobacteria bacterium]
MAKKENKQGSESVRQREQEALLKEALAKPGVRELMKIYGHWQEKDRELDAYRAGTTAYGRLTAASNSSDVL